MALLPSHAARPPCCNHGRPGPRIAPGRARRRGRGRRPGGAHPLPRADGARRRQGHRVRRDRRGDRVPGVRDPARPARQPRAHPARPARPAGGRLPHRVLHQDRARAARGVDQLRGDPDRGRAGHPAGDRPDQRRVRVHLVARWPARARRPAARAAVVGGVDLRHQRRDRGRRRCAGQARAAGVHREPRRRVRPALDLPAPRRGERARAVAGRGRRLDRRQHRHHGRGERRGRNRR